MENLKTIAENYANIIVDNNVVFNNLSNNVKAEIKKEIINAYMKEDENIISDSLDVFEDEPDRVDADIYEDDYVNEFEAIDFKLRK